MYDIYTFDQKTGEMIFKVDNPGEGSIYVSINVKKGNIPNFSDYRDKPKRGYIREDTGDIELVGTLMGLENPFRPIPPPRVFQTIDGKDVKYNLASQYDYDKWSAREFPDYDNAKIFNLLEGLTRSRAEDMCK
jgi:hypothetical protein